MRKLLVSLLVIMLPLCSLAQLGTGGIGIPGLRNPLSEDLDAGGYDITNLTSITFADGSTITGSYTFVHVPSSSNYLAFVGSQLQGCVTNGGGGIEGTNWSKHIALQNVDMQGFLVTNHGTPVANSDVATKGYVDAQVAIPLTNTAVYGAIYIHDGSFTNALTPSDTFVIMENWTLGDAVGVTLSASNMTVNADATYLLGQYHSFSDGNSKTIEAAFFVNGVEQQEGECKRKLGVSGDVGSFSGAAILPLNAGDVVDIRMKCIGSTADVVIEDGQFVISLLSSVTAGTNWSQHPALNDVNVNGHNVTNANDGHFTNIYFDAAYVGTNTNPIVDVVVYVDLSDPLSTVSSRVDAVTGEYAVVDSYKPVDKEFTNTLVWIQMYTNISTAPFDGFATLDFLAHEDHAFGETPPGHEPSYRFVTNGGVVADSYITNTVYLAGAWAWPKGAVYECTEGTVYTNVLEGLLDNIAAIKTSKFSNARFNIVYGREQP